ncbi:MAG: TolC family protein [Bacteroidetes bacterium]|nr:TolC family protein [Bacteroidota bacterium]
MKFKFAILFSLFSLLLQADSLSVFSLEDFLNIVKQNHPVAKQADLQKRMGEAQLLKNKGLFDPYIYSQLSQKNFNNKNYYSINENGVEMPTRIGVKLKAAYDVSEGVFLNPENSTSVNGLLSSGVSVPLLQGLFTDQRRTALKQARLYQDATVYERQLMLNNLVFDAINAYLEWALSYNQLLVYKDVLDLAQIRFDGVKSSYLFGDRAEIDTVEAFIQYQTRKADYFQAQQNYAKNSIYLSEFLWTERLTPLQLASSTYPASFSALEEKIVIKQDSLERIITNLPYTQPAIKISNYKVQFLKAERLLKIEKIKPKLDVDYNFLTESVTPNYSQLLNYNSNNYKWGFSFSFPLLVREARGDLNFTKAKMQDADYDYTFKIVEYTNKVKSYYVEFVNASNQVGFYKNIAANQFRLLNAEKSNFDSGEGSIFMINIREQNLLSARLKLVEQQIKYEKAYYSIYWSAGLLAL